MNIPLNFIEERLPITWTDVSFGIRNQLVDGREVINFAAKTLASDPENEELLALASVDLGDPIIDLVEILAKKERTCDEFLARQKWAFFVLAWLYENKDQENDPLAVVEMIYADFEYPADIAPFVRYMPMEGPDLGSRELNEARLYERWRSYLEDARARLAG